MLISHKQQYVKHNSGTDYFVEVLVYGLFKLLGSIKVSYFVRMKNLLIQIILKTINILMKKINYNSIKTYIGNQIIYLV